MLSVTAVSAGVEDRERHGAETKEEQRRNSSDEPVFSELAVYFIFEDADKDRNTHYERRGKQDDHLHPAGSQWRHPGESVFEVWSWCAALKRYGRPIEIVWKTRARRHLLHIR